MPTRAPVGAPSEPGRERETSNAADETRDVFEIYP